MQAIVNILNVAMNRLFDLLVWPFGALAPIWPMLFISLVAGVLMLWIFGKVSNQKAIKVIRNRIRGNLIGVALFQDDIGVLLRLQGTILLDTLKYMRYSLIPMLVMIIPVMAIMIQLNLRFAARPLAPGESTAFKVQVRDASAIKEGVELEAPEGISIETSAVRIPSERQVAWRIRADQPGRYAMTVKLGEETIEKDLVVGEGWASVSPLRSGHSIIDNLLYPGEAPLPASRMIESVSVNYPGLEIFVFGFVINWLVLFFVLSIVFGFAFKGVLGIEV